MAGAELQAMFDREFRGHIERLREPLVAALRKLIATPLPAGEFEVLSFEMQADWRDFPVYAFAMDREAVNEEYFEPPFKGNVLPRAGPLIPKGSIDQDRYEDSGVATFESGARVLAEWFGECWHAAGGVGFQLPAYISLHDGSRYFDLRARRWVRAIELGA
ncbi:hypothetical protein R5W23_005044 [Gemmata sp. JC673]|uniref:DUF1963 domain-containing protein n=1 Tax=Gemmata algarum TaxID=2975278 RepID=A0ABU5ETQ8_9BACT|nr:hypothetical protein [Gemmata algarum]MDY3558349.1 hypothetical protein [Gemmata algarum]